eukprot:TRINITY_DN4851_c0_g1_i1.p1 TRINITY_DN4851_c0_g1~~TRINITY_DN4851_c0_g1_i1.p1  ORF type:complete len:609 (-),score=78.12 TRINITY_DN4851_c0_g1_i1:393-2219(-)
MRDVASVRSSNNSFTATSSDVDSVVSRISLKSTFIDVPEPKTVLRRTKSCPDHEMYASPMPSLFHDEREYVDNLWGRAQSVYKGGGPPSECSSVSSCSTIQILPQLPPSALSPTGYASCHATSPLNIPNTRMHRLSSAKTMASSNRGLTQALATIEELPQQLQEALQQKLVAAVTDMKGSLLDLCSHIQATPGAERELATQLAIERISRIPDQFLQDINGKVAEVKESIEAEMESFVMFQAQPEGSPLDQETLVNEMSLIPTQVEEIARGVVDRAINNTSLKAVAQMDRALAALSTHDTQLAEVRNQVMAALPGAEVRNSMSLAAEQVAKMNVQDAIASARGNRSCTATENKNIASWLMYSKAEMRDQPRQGTGSESVGTSRCALRSNPASEGGDESTPRGARLTPANLQRGLRGYSSLATASGSRTAGPFGATARETVSSAGSKGHPEMCKKPCVFFQAGQCQELASCRFCHLAHPKRSTHLDKRNRELLMKLPASCRVQILLHAMRSRALMLPFERAALEFLDTLDSQCHAWDSVTQEPALHLDKGFHRLRSALLGQVFSSLTSLFFKVTSEEMDPAAVSRMRQALAKFQDEIERLYFAAQIRLLL